VRVFDGLGLSHRYARVRQSILPGNRGEMAHFDVDLSGLHIRKPLTIALKSKVFNCHVAC
jgi:hypothetical protein